MTYSEYCRTQRLNDERRQFLTKIEALGFYACDGDEDLEAELNGWKEKLRARIAADMARMIDAEEAGYDDERE